ncbi:MAG: hypothetical protein JWM25_485, partial [Thermoleophilia bacterium]|nr:hypothetical protein [Thermoleophilia bacterium]
GGVFEAREEYCAAMEEQRTAVADFVLQHIALLYAAGLALFALGGAATTHLAVLWRARRIGVATRPSRRIAELEVHYSAAYVAAAGLVLLLAAPDSGAVGVLVESLGAGAAVLGGSLLVGQGFGLATWLAARRKMRGWQRVVFIVVALLVPQVSLPLLASLGMVDIAVRPRRRSSATLTGRGTGS